MWYKGGGANKDTSLDEPSGSCRFLTNKLSKYQTYGDIFSFYQAIDTEDMIHHVLPQSGIEKHHSYFPV